jgi:uncharacterized protein GlcG (DUF336 family)
MTRSRHVFTSAVGAAIVSAVAFSASAQNVNCPVSHSDLETALMAVAPDGAGNGGLDNNMWATVVNRDGVVCNVARTGDLNAQWPASRVISAQKAHTAWSLSLDQGTGGTVDALSTANLWAATQPGGSLWELTQSNPVNANKAYNGNRNKFGTPGDPLQGTKLGGINTFGGGLALYDSDGTIVGGLGASGDTSCADHNVAWRVRDGLGLDYVPSGVGSPGDNIIYDIQAVASHTDHPATVSTSGFGHPTCGFGEDTENANIVLACPLGDGTTADTAPDCPSLTAP